MYNLVLIAIFKNESHILQEWLNHYIKMGVDKFMLIDNASTDNYFHLIKPYIATGKVVLTKDPKKWSQEELYNKYYLKYCKYSKWVMVVDLDEFIYARRGYNTIIQYLNTIPKQIGCIKIPWKMFGSNGHIKQPKSVIQSFTKREVKDGESACKVIMRGSLIRYINIHYSIPKHTSMIVITPNNRRCTVSWLGLINENIIKDSFLHLNHYPIQSSEWFKNVKCTRGAADFKKHENVRNEQYFKNYDLNDIVDEELKMIYS